MIVRWLMTLALSVTAPAVWASFDIINTGEIFPAVVQGHHGNNNNCHQISGNQLYQVNREFNFEVRHSPMPPDGTLRIP